MNRKLMLTAVLLVAISITGLAAQSVQAQESTVGQYRTSLRGVLPIVDGWLSDLDGHLTAISAKPELACSPEYQELVRRGGWVTDDLRGTGLLAPLSLSGYQVRAVDGLERIVLGAALIAESCEGATLEPGMEAVDAGRDAYYEAVVVLRFFATPPAIGRPGSALPAGVSQ